MRIALGPVVLPPEVVPTTLDWSDDVCQYHSACDERYTERSFGSVPVISRPGVGISLRRPHATQLFAGHVVCEIALQLVAAGLLLVRHHRQ